MTGCHNCKNAPTPGMEYSKTACAQCYLGKKFAHKNSTRNEVLGDNIQIVDPDFAFFDDDNDSAAAAVIDLESISFAVFNLLEKLIQIHVDHPITFGMIYEKIRSPNVTYSELAARFNCRKQNVHYHMKRGASLCPELAEALLIDTRWNNSYNSIQQTVFRNIMSGIQQKFRKSPPPRKNPRKK